MASLQARYAAAVDDVYDQLEIAAGMADVPSGDPKHVFDTEDGVRLIISRERFPDERIGIHVSASLNEKARPLLEQIKAAGDEQARTEMCVDVIRSRFALVARTDRRLVILGVTPGNYVIHMVLWD